MRIEVKYWIFAILFAAMAISLVASESLSFIPLVIGSVVCVFLAILREIESENKER